MRFPRRRYRAVLYTMLGEPPDTSRFQYELPWRWFGQSAEADLSSYLAAHRQINAHDWHGYVEARA